MAFLIALSVLLTNLLSYSFFVVGGMIRLALGNFLLFTTGMIFGPFSGMIAGLLSDTLGTLINNGGVYHFGFAFAKALFGLSGGLVFLFKNNQWLSFKIISYFSLNFLVYSFVISPLSVASLYNSFTLATLMGISKLIRLPIELGIYLPLVFISFNLLSFLLWRVRSRQKKGELWCFRNGKVMAKKRSKFSNQDDSSPLLITKNEELGKNETEEVN